MNVVKTETTSPYSSSTSGETTTSSVLGQKGVISAADKYLYFNDSSMFAYKAEDAVKCTLADGATKHVCEGFIDVNGLKGPNKVVDCSTGTTTKDEISTTDNAVTGITQTTATCEVASPTDIYPVFFYDQTMLPATNAARAVLYGK